MSPNKFTVQYFRTFSYWGGLLILFLRVFRRAHTLVCSASVFFFRDEPHSDVDLHRFDVELHY